MFDFLNTTYSGLSSILSALFGFSYPLVIGCIEKIDSKFGSTKLSERFQSEYSYKWFNILLVINLAMAVLSPPLIEWCAHAHAKIIMGVQVGGTISMIFSALCLFRKIISYYNITELQKGILDDYNTAVRKQDKEKEKEYFIQWIDLSGELLKSADDKLVRSVYMVLSEYVERAYKINSSKALEFEIYFYNGISRINEFLSKGEARQESINNTNSILSLLIWGDSIVSDLSYKYLWKNLRIQMFYDKDEWIMEYWESASQKIRLFMNTTHISPYNQKGELDTKKMEEIKNKKKQREEFLEFHIMLCSMLLQQKKYELLEQMLSFTQTEPPSYPLVPSTFSEILDVFNSVNHNISADPIHYESRYRMPKMHGITEGKIAGAANCYLALLAYRIYAIRWDYGYGSVLNTGALPNTLSELATLSNNLNLFKYWLGGIRHDQELLQVVGIRTLAEGNEDKAQIYAVKPDLLVSNMQDEIDEKMKNLKETSPLNDEKVASEQKELTDNIRRAMEGYADLLGKRFEQEEYYNLNSSISVSFPNTAFWGISDVNGTAESVSSSMLESFQHLFASAFFAKHSNTDYRLSSEDLFKAIDKLALNEQHYIIAFGIYFDYYIGTVEGLEKELAHKYTYNKIRILSLDCSTEYFSQMLYIMKYKDRPFLDFPAPSEEEQKKRHLEEKDKSYGLWLSIKKISEHPDLLTEPIKAQLGDKADQHSLFTAIWRPRLFFKDEKYPMVSIKVKYGLTDEGDYDSVDKVKPFPLKETSTKQVNNQ